MSDKPLTDLNKGRGKREGAPLGTFLFTSLRLIDIPLQYYLLLNAPLTIALPKLGLSAPTSPSNNPMVYLTGLGTAQSIIWAMSIGSAAKHIIHLLFISKEPMYPKMAIFVAILNTVFNSANSLMFTISPAMPAQYPQYQLYVGVVLYVIGILVETGSETQRRLFKDKSENDGKVFTGGLFSLARHINYSGYTCWRSAYAIACGGPVWGGLMMLFVGSDFANRGIPVLDQYCSKRYGQQWVKYKENVPWKLLPGIY